MEKGKGRQCIKCISCCYVSRFRTTYIYGVHTTAAYCMKPVS